MSIRFVPSESKRIFVGRGDQVHDFLELVGDENRHEWIVFMPGNGGIGKTSLMNHFRAQCAEKMSRSDLVAPIVDFYDTSNQSDAGLLRCLARELKFESFEGEYARYQGYLEMEEIPDPVERQARFERLKSVFFNEYAALLKQKKRVCLFFDTCEEMHGVRNWFLEHFIGELRKAETELAFERGNDERNFKHQTLIVMAGREKGSLEALDWRDFGMGADEMKIYRLDDLSLDEVRSYLKSDPKVARQINDDQINALYDRTVGRPLYVALTFDWLWNEVGSADDLVKASGEFKESLVSWARRLEPRKKMAILFMALAWRRMEFDLLKKLIGAEKGEVERLIEELSGFSFVKYRVMEEKPVVNLHDEMRDLINAIVWPREKEPQSPWPLEATLEWYANEIGNPKLLTGGELPTGDRERALLAEWLYYKYKFSETSRDFTEASKSYEAIFRSAVYKLDLALCETLNQEAERFRDLLSKKEKDDLQFRQGLTALRKEDRNALTLLRDLLADESLEESTRATVLMLLSELESYQGQPNEAIKRAVRAETLYKRMIAKERDPDRKKQFMEQLGQLYNNWGFACRVKGDLDQALDRYQMALKTPGAKKLTPKHKARVLNNIGYIYFRKGDIVKARTYVGRALRIRQNLKIPYDLGFSYNTMGLIMEDHGRVHDAADQYLKAYLAFEDADNERGKAVAYTSMGRIQRTLNNYDKALDYLKNAVQILKRIKDKDSLVTALNELGCVYRDMKEYDDALVYLEESLARSREMGAGKIREQADTLEDIAVIFYEKAHQKTDGEATEFRRKAREYAKKIIALIKPKGKQFEFLMSKAERMLGDLDYLEKDFDKAFDHYFAACRMMARAWLAKKKTSVFLQQRYEEALDRMQEQLHALEYEKDIREMRKYSLKLRKRLEKVQSPAERKALAPLREYLAATEETAKLVE